MEPMLRRLLTVLLLAAVAAGCGSAGHTPSAARHGVPRALARQWEVRASAVAAAASAGEDCQALHLASSLRDQVVATQQQLPRRLRVPLVDGVKALAARITCTPPPPVVTKPPTEPKPKPKPPPDGHDHHGHHGHDGGDGSDR
jgi:outer membrane PBP1 activator LpoA protein